MSGNINSKIVGSAIIGFALIAGAFTLRDFGTETKISQIATVSKVSTERASISVSDNDNNGIEDWRDEFVTVKPVILTGEQTDYTPPDTVTGRMSIGFLENFITARGYGPYGDTDEEVVNNTVSSLTKEVKSTLYSRSDIDIMQSWEDDDIKNYANTLAATIYRNSDSNIDGELQILYDILQNKNPERVSDLISLTAVYKGYRDDTLKIPVPKPFAKAHLDLINTYEAIYEDIYAMSLVLDDPIVSLLHIKRYQEDATGLAYALQNIYTTLTPYGDLFGKDDPALLFVAFSPDFKI